MQHTYALCLYSTTADGKWYAGSCDQGYMSVCTIPVQSDKDIHTSLMVQSHAQCPMGYIQGLAPTDCYFFRSQDSWYDADRYCMWIGGRLPIVKSDTENKFMDTVLNACGADPSSSSLWLGATAGILTTEWKWTDGSPLSSYTSWATGQLCQYTSCRCVRV